MIFTEFGRPHSPRNDNGPCYRSTEFKEFQQLHGVLHITCSPHHHQSNGFTEAVVKIENDGKIFRRRKTLKCWIPGTEDNSYLRHYSIPIEDTDEQKTKGTATTDGIMLPSISTEFLKNLRAVDVQKRQTSMYCRICNHQTRARTTNQGSGT